MQKIGCQKQTDRNRGSKLESLFGMISLFHENSFKNINLKYVYHIIMIFFITFEFSQSNNIKLMSDSYMYPTSHIRKKNHTRL